MIKNNINSPRSKNRQGKGHEEHNDNTGDTIISNVSVDKFNLYSVPDGKQAWCDNALAQGRDREPKSRGDTEGLESPGARGTGGDLEGCSGAGGLMGQQVHNRAS